MSEIGEAAVDKNQRSLEDILDKEVLDSAAKGDKSVLPAVKKICDTLPEFAVLLGDLAVEAQTLMMELTTGGHLLLREAQERELASLKKKLRGPSTSALEDLLIDRIVLCWQHVHLAERKYALAGLDNSGGLDHWQNHINRAQTRYLQAIKALAQVRKLKVPLMQVNIATKEGKQVNVLGDVKQES